MALFLFSCRIDPSDLSFQLLKQFFRRPVWLQSLGLASFCLSWQGCSLICSFNYDYVNQQMQKICGHSRKMIVMLDRSNRSDGKGRTLADGTGISLFKTNVTTLSPGKSPTVLDRPSLLTGSNQEDSVIDVFGAVVEDSTFIGRPVSSIHTHSHGSSHNQLLNLIASVAFSNTEGSELSTCDLASSVLGSVGVFGLGGLAIVLDVLQTTDSVASVASVVFIGRASGAINQLLLTQVDVVGLALELNLIAFVGSSSSEGPARSALTLILDLGNNTLGPPINLHSESCIHRLIQLTHLNIHLSQIGLDELFLGHIGELIDAHLPSLSGVCVVLLHGLEEFSKNLAAVDELIA